MSLFFLASVQRAVLPAAVARAAALAVLAAPGFANAEISQINSIAYEGGVLFKQDTFDPHGSVDELPISLPGSYGHIDLRTSATARGSARLTTSLHGFGDTPISISQYSLVADPTEHYSALSSASGVIDVRSGEMKLAAHSVGDGFDAVWAYGYFEDTLTFQTSPGRVPGAEAIKLELFPEFTAFVPDNFDAGASYTTSLRFGELDYSFTASLYWETTNYYDEEYQIDVVSRNLTTSYIGSACIIWSPGSCLNLADAQPGYNYITAYDQEGLETTYLVNLLHGGGIQFFHYMQEPREVIQARWMTGLYASGGAWVDSLHTTTVAFDLPEGVTLSANSGFAGAAVPGGVVPEPTTWAMLIGGFAGAGAALRRRRIVPA